MSELGALAVFFTEFNEPEQPAKTPLPPSIRPHQDLTEALRVVVPELMRKKDRLGPEYFLNGLGDLYDVSMIPVKEFASVRRKLN